MVTHYFTLQSLCRELEPRIRQSTIVDVFSQRRNELVVSLSRCTEAGGEGSLVVSVDPTLNTFYLRNRIPRARQNSVTLFRETIGQRIESLSLHPGDRTIALTLGGELAFNAQLYNSAASNVVLVRIRDRRIEETFKDNNALCGTSFVLTRKPIDENLLYVPEVLRSALDEHSSRPIGVALRQLFPLFGSLYVKEVLERSSVIGDQQRSMNLSTEQIAAMQHAIRNILDESNHPKPTIYFRDGTPWILSIVPLRHLDEEECKHFLTTNDAVREFLAKRRRSGELETSKKAIVAGLEREMTRIRRSIASVERELTETMRVEEYDRIGKTILANIPVLAKGMNHANLPDPFAEGNTISVELDPRLTPPENAERYFGKVRKARLARLEAKTRLDDLQTRRSTIEQLLLEAQSLTTDEDVKEFIDRNRSDLGPLNPAGKKAEREQPPFRTFTVAGEHEVWVGKSSANNDLLTTKYARPHDLWFHARGVGGSHTVLRVKDRTQAPPREAVRQAASIAAYYSKMRNASTVPVAYCERKYVRKLRKAPEGTVVLEREEVIFVEPGLPQRSLHR
jgi:predicted ribosome quality control (RQC) complex YloA/Tae2 family protein